MPPNKNPDNQPADPPEGWHINRTATFAATTLLAVLTGTPRWQPAEYHPAAGDQSSQSGSAVAGTPGEAHVQPAPEQEIDYSAEMWARLFSTDEHAGELTGYDQLSKVRQLIEQRQAAGYRITGITIEGYASDEDNSVDAEGHRTGGLREPSAENRELAATRADDFRPMLRDDLAEHNVDGVPPIVTLPPVEDMVSPGEKQHIDHLAQKFGYREPVRLIEAYNRQQNVPPEVNEYLDEVLARQRQVIVRVNSEKIDQGGTPPQATLTGNEGDTGTSTDVIDLNAPLLLFMIVPWYRRRREEEPGTAIEPAAPLQPAAMVSATPIEAAAAPVATPLPSAVMPAATLPAATIPSATAESAVLRSRVLPPPVRKDAAYRRRTAAPPVQAVSRAPRPMSQKQPRPQNMHGYKGANRHLERSKGGNRRGKTSSVRIS